MRDGLDLRRQAVKAGLWLAMSLAAGIGVAPVAAAESQSGVRATLASTPGVDGPMPPVLAEVSLSSQTMSVYLDAKLSYTFSVSTGRAGYTTPTGSWQAQWLSPRHRSSKYNNAPMPWSVFFYKGYAVHGTNELDALGQPASHGCIRLATEEAKIFFDLVKEYGMPNTLIAVVN